MTQWFLLFSIYSNSVIFNEVEQTFRSWLHSCIHGTQKLSVQFQYLIRSLYSNTFRVPHWQTEWGLAFSSASLWALSIFHQKNGCGWPNSHSYKWVNSVLNIHNPSLISFRKCFIFTLLHRRLYTLICKWNRISQIMRWIVVAMHSLQYEIKIKIKKCRNI